jgi:hypothetical protein
MIQGHYMSFAPPGAIGSKHDFRSAESAGSSAFGQGCVVSSDRQFGHSADSRNLAASQIPAEISKILLEFFKRPALRQIVGEFLEAA